MIRFDTQIFDYPRSVIRVRDESLKGTEPTLREDSVLIS
jgi:hypothetical protein